MVTDLLTHNREKQKRASYIKTGVFCVALTLLCEEEKTKNEVTRFTFFSLAEERTEVKANQKLNAQR